MKKIVSIAILVLLLSSFLIEFASSKSSLESSQKNVYYFYSATCSHCKNVADSGILEKIDNRSDVSVLKYLIDISTENQQKFIELADKVGAPYKVPLAVIEVNGRYSFLQGDSPIINDIESALEDNFVKVGFFDRIKASLEKSFMLNVNSETGKLTGMGVLLLILIALIDAINPCAFGVLLFLMAGLLSMGSSKRALKAGLLYTFVIFATYFTAGLLIAKTLVALQSSLHYILLIVGGLIFIGGLIEIKDFFWYGKGFSLKIPESTKPKIQNLIHKGTLPAILVLGILVALVELPCTGGIYLAILSLMTTSRTFAISYLALYNLIFVLPLIAITFFVYKGTRTDSIKLWVEDNKRIMRLVAGIIMILLALYLFTAI